MTRSTAAVRAALAVALLLALPLAMACGDDAQEPAGAGQMTAMEGMPRAHGAQLPPVKGLYAHEQILFVHSEASTEEIAKVLTDMMGSPVLVVPELAEVPPEALGDVYVFRNGVRGDGPLGHQLDVFDSSPEDPEYTPLRAVSFVTWRDEASARTLGSAQEVLAAREEGDVRIEVTDVVVNMPFLRWPGGKR